MLLKIIAFAIQWNSNLEFRQAVRVRDGIYMVGYARGCLLHTSPSPRDRQ